MKLFFGCLFFIASSVCGVTLDDCIEILNKHGLDIAKEIGQNQAIGESYDSDKPFIKFIDGVEIKVIPKPINIFGLEYPLYAVSDPQCRQDGERKYVYIEFFNLKSYVQYKGKQTNTIKAYCTYDEQPQMLDPEIDIMW